MAATNKCLAWTNKSHTRADATKAVTAACRNSPAPAKLASPVSLWVTLPVFYRPLVALKLNMSWHDPELYIFLCVIAVFAGVLAIIDECIQKFCRRKPKQGDEPAYLRKARPLDGLLRGRPLRRRVAYNLRIRARR